jgi:hypothetical protein
LTALAARFHGTKLSIARLGARFFPIFRNRKVCLFNARKVWKDVHVNIISVQISTVFCLLVSKFAKNSWMPETQPPLPGMSPRGRPRSGISSTERIRRYQAARRKSSSRKMFSVEIDGVVLAAFKAAATSRKMTFPKAAEAAMKAWMAALPSVEMRRGEL